jgi:hypothetical protein
LPNLAVNLLVLVYHFAMRSLSFSDEFWKRLHAELATVSPSLQLGTVDEFQGHLEALINQPLPNAALGASSAGASNSASTAVRKKRTTTLSADISAEASRAIKAPRTARMTARNDGRKRISEKKKRSGLGSDDDYDYLTDVDSGECCICYFNILILIYITLHR